MGILAVDSSVKIFAFSLLFAISYISFAGAHPEGPNQVKDLASCLDYVEVQIVRDYDTKNYDKRRDVHMKRCREEKRSEDFCTVRWLWFENESIIDAYDDCRKKYKR